MSAENPPNHNERIRQLLSEQGITVGSKDTLEGNYATLVKTITADGNELMGRILEINYEDPEPFMIQTVHGRQARKRIPLHSIVGISTASSGNEKGR